MQTWDALRTDRTNILDGVLDSLGAQPVPPDFHETSSDSSLFGSPHSDSDEGHENENTSPHNSPSLTIRHPIMNGSNGRIGLDKGKGAVHGNGKVKERKDRSRWKNLRDFVDERSINEALETMETERALLDVGHVSIFPDYSFDLDPVLLLIGCV